MVNPQGTSFIPQRPVRNKAEPRRVRKIYVLAYLAYVIFFGSLVAAGLVFFFKFSLDVQLDAQREALELERQKFNQGDIESIRDLDKRLQMAEERLNNHVSVLAVFEALERSAVQSLSYTAFTYKRLNDTFPLITFSGTSDRFNNILFQREVLASNPILAGSSFEEMQVQSKTDPNNTALTQEIVTFTLQKEVDTSLIGYTPRVNTQTSLPEEDEVVQDGEEEASDASVQTEAASEETQ